MRWTFSILALATLAALLLIDVSGDFPLNDDWQYAFGVQSLLETGQLRYRGVFSPIVLTQVGWAALFCECTGAGFSFECLRWSTLVLLLPGLWLLLYLGRTLGQSRHQIWLLGLVLLSCPLVLVLGSSFMSDVPFAVFALAATVAYWQFFRGEQWGYGLLSLVLAALAFYVRQPGMVLPVAFGLHYGWQHRSRGQSGRLIAAGGVFYGLFLLVSWEVVVKPALGLAPHMKSDMYRYLGQLSTTPVAFAKSMGLRQIKNIVYLGLFSIPLLPWLRVKLPRREWWILAGLSAGFVVLAHLAGKPFPFGGNIFYNWGLGPELLVDTYTLGLANTPQMPQWILDVLHFLATATMLIIGRSLWLRWGALTERDRAYWRLWLAVALCYFPLMAITSYYDRYVLFPLWLWWPAVLSLAVVVKGDLELNPPSRVSSLRRLGLAVVPVVIYLYFSLAATHDYLAWNRAKWQAFQQLQAQGVGIEQMDAGYELNGWYNYGQKRYEDDQHSFWWVTDDTYLLTFGPVAGYHQIGEVSFQRWLWWRTDSIHILQKHTP
jgi:hypothetical protein